MRYLTRADLDWISDSVVMIQHGSSIGTGFFVLPGVVASCQHVVEPAAPEQPRLLWRGRALPLARIVASPRPSTLDLALFEIAETGHPLLPIARGEAGIGDVFSFGYQYTERGYSGYSLWGTLGGYAVDTSAEAPQQLLLISGANIQPGASGAPLFSLEDGKVVGVVKRSNPDGGGYAVRIEELEDLRPGILDRSRELAPARELTQRSLTRYVQQVEREHSHIAMVDLRRELKLEDIYVSITLAPQSVTGAPMALGVAGTLSSTANMVPIEKVDARRDLGSPQRHYRQAEVPLGELLSQPAAIIIGEPGAGKTTLLRHLLLRTCRGELFTGRIPVFIKVANVKREPGCFAKYVESVYTPHASAILEATTEGKAVYFIDGFDEIPKSDHEIVQNEVNRLAADQNTVFVTCRSAAFPKGLFSSAFKVFECFGFNASQQRRFLRQWFAGQQHLALRLERQLRISKGVAGFARNPLLLSFLAIVFENDPEFRLPTQRVELYKRVVDVFLERRASLTGVPSLPRHVKLQFLERLAFDLMSGAVETVDEEDLLSRIESWQATSTNRKLQDLSSEEVLDHLVEQDGVLAKATPQSFRFIHLTFQEYLAATYLADLDDWAKVVASRSSDPRWEEVLRLLAGSLQLVHADRLVGLLWSTTSHGGPATSLQQRFLAARCASDVQQVSSEILTSLTSELLQCVFGQELEPVVTEATATLAALCSSHPAVLNVVQEFIERQAAHGGLSFLVLFRHVQLLDLTASSDSTVELLQLLGQTREGAGEDEAITLLAGAIITGLGHSGDPTLIPHLAPVLDGGSSYIAASAATALVDLQDESTGPVLQNHRRSQRGEVRVLAASVLFRSLDAENLRGLLESVFCDEPDAVAQLTARQTIDPDSCDPDAQFVRRLLQHCPGEADRALLLGLTWLIAYLDDTAFLEQLAFDVGGSPVLRCAALEAFLRLQPSQADEVLTRLLDANDSTLVRACLAVLGRTGNSHGHGVLLQRVGHSSQEWLLNATIHLFTQVWSLPTQDWLLDLVRAAPSRSETQIRVLMALAAQRREAIIPILREYLDLPPEQHVRERVIAYQALAQIGSEVAYDLIVRHLFAESNIVIITQAIEALGEMGLREAEQPLLRCLSSGRWPPSWPPPEPALQPGEQRPTDRRRLAAIIGLNKLGSVSALDALQEIADDPEEAVEARQAAYIAVRTIAWNAGALPAVPAVSPATQPSESQPDRRRRWFLRRSG